VVELVGTLPCLAPEGPPDLLVTHKLIAELVAGKPARLTPAEVRFLRKYLGLSGRDFAKRMGVSPETVSRWERVDEPRALAEPTEKLLRLMALVATPVEHYEPELEFLDDIAQGEPTPIPLRVTASAGNWMSVAAAA